MKFKSQNVYNTQEERIAHGSHLAKYTKQLSQESFKEKHHLSRHMTSHR